MEYIKLFNEHSGYTEYTNVGVSRPSVSHCIEENHVHYDPVLAPLICIYNVTDASQQTKLYHYSNTEGDRGVDLFDKVEIDGVEVSIADLDSASGKTQLSVGEHTVRYTLKDPTTITGGLFGSCGTLTSVTIPNGVVSIGTAAFQYCENLSEVILSKTVTSIGNGAFGCCGSNLPLDDILAINPNATYCK